MATDNKIFLGAVRYAGTAVAKLSKTKDFCCFWPGLPNDTADCSAPCGLTWLKVYVVNGLGHGYRLLEFCQGAMKHAEAAVENPANIDGFCQF